MTEWQPVIGLEVHVQLKTRSKSFSASAVRFGEAPNTLCDPTVLGLPGALPVFNKAALDCAIRLGLALGCSVRPVSRFARKHYFYPDLPKGYQISQFDEPICEGGRVEVITSQGTHEVSLTRIHLEEDAGKNTHHRGGRSLVDLNRAGVALCEIVTEPVIESAGQAAAYMRSLRQLVRYLGISDGDMEKGQLRCDANVSVKPVDETELGTRAELKNINSFKFVEKAIEHEITRQIAVIEGGGKVVQETRLWDSDAGVSRSMRGKEEAMDYRYFPDPDLPPLRVEADRIERIRDELPELPAAAMRRLLSMNLSADDAALLCAERATLGYFDATLLHLKKARAPQSEEGIREAETAEADTKHAKLAANWIQADLLAELNRRGEAIESCSVSPERLAGLLELVQKGSISGKVAKGVLGKMFAGEEEATAIVEREGLTQISDESQLGDIIDELIRDNAKQADQVRAGNSKLLSFFVGQVMKRTKGQANPAMVSQLLRKRLS